MTCRSLTRRYRPAAEVPLVIRGRSPDRCPCHVNGRLSPRGLPMPVCWQPAEALSPWSRSGYAWEELRVHMFLEGGRWIQ